MVVGQVLARLGREEQVKTGQLLLGGGCQGPVHHAVVFLHSEPPVADEPGLDVGLQVVYHDPEEVPGRVGAGVVVPDAKRLEFTEAARRAHQEVVHVPPAELPPVRVGVSQRPGRGLIQPPLEHHADLGRGARLAVEARVHHDLIHVRVTWVVVWQRCHANLRDKSWKVEGETGSLF